MPTTLQEWFCLKEGRDNFKPHVIRDQNLFFCHEQQLQDEILRSIKRRYAGNEPVKMLLYGDWGVGKTHTARHICWWLNQNKNDYPAKPVVIEIGDMTAKSRFDTLVRPFLEELGLDFLIDLSRKYLQLKPNLVQALQQAGVSLYVATVISKFNMATPGITPPAVVDDAFNCLKGRKPPSAAASVGLGQQIVESNELFGVLLAIGEMYRAVNKERMIFIADEAAKLNDVEDDETTRAHWVATNRLIFDDNNNTFGFIYTLSAANDRALPSAIWHPQLQNRIGQNKYLLENLKPQDVGSFIRKLIDQFVDKAKVDQLAQDGQIPASDYDWANYPFNAEARTLFIDHYQRDQENAKPRDISEKLNELGFIALSSESRLIKPDCLSAAGM